MTEPAGNKQGSAELPVTEPEGSAELSVTKPEESGSAGLPLRVSTLELFFDLVFVFAITQLTGILSHHASVVGGVQVLLVFGALWWMYGGYVWLSNARTPVRTPERLLMQAGWPCTWRATWRSGTHCGSAGSGTGPRPR